MVKTKTISVDCSRCGNNRTNHRVLHEKVETFYDDEYGPSYEKLHRLVECMGCESIKYVISERECSPDDEEYNINIYPTISKAPVRSVLLDIDELNDAIVSTIPKPVSKMYKETVDAFNANIRTLAGGGLRATVEAICLDKKIIKGSLQDKIEQLVKENLLTPSQAELLHEERYLGNAALHELETPSIQDISDGLGIVEGLINTIYILPIKAKRLRERRTQKRGK